jgi:aspartyl/asparaginyl beta-hydroxylase (cupin superfamily)
MARQGRLDEAGRLWTEVLRLEPGHPRALLFLGQQTLHRGDARSALDLLSRAADAAPKEPLAWLNLSFARRALGDGAGEIEALDRALAADPYCYPALLAKGAFLMRIGRPREAARVYRDALTILPPDDQVPQPFRLAVTKAHECVAANAQALETYLTSRLKPLRGSSREDRFDECLGIATGTKKRYVQDASVLLVPQLPPLSFYDTAQFPWLSGIVVETDAIREELLVLLKEDGAEFAPYVQHPDGVPLNQWAELNRSPRWSAFFLWKNGERVEAHCGRCPRTAAAVEKLPLAQMSGYAPTVFFSTLEPHTRIPPHTGATNARLIVHIPLVVPGHCSFRVGNDVREWKPGEALVFDDTMEHEAINDSDKLRVVLIFDIWNPYLTESERALIQELLLGMRDYYSAS